WRKGGRIQCRRQTAGGEGSRNLVALVDRGRCRITRHAQALRRAARTLQQAVQVRLRAQLQIELDAAREHGGRGLRSHGEKERPQASSRGEPAVQTSCLPRLTCGRLCLKTLNM